MNNISTLIYIVNEFDLTEEQSFFINDYESFDTELECIMPKVELISPPDHILKRVLMQSF